MNDYQLIEVRSDTDPSRVHVVDLRDRNCSCKGFRQNVMEIRDHLKHYGRDPDKFIFMVEAGIEDPLSMVE
ncbi:hypothetical protein MUP00_03775, partial [Candidatus Bathyarchaeota archaeon]|nr:hypothetical protein [Candidatus Bathyarchaeota archaeon]